jgi:hypothetical protein
VCKPQTQTSKKRTIVITRTEGTYKIIIFNDNYPEWRIRIVDINDEVYGYWDRWYDEYSGYDQTHPMPQKVEDLINKYETMWDKGEL